MSCGPSNDLAIFSWAQRRCTLSNSYCLVQRVVGCDADLSLFLDRFNKKDRCQGDKRVGFVIALIDADEVFIALLQCALYCPATISAKVDLYDLSNELFDHHDCISRGGMFDDAVLVSIVNVWVSFPE